MVQINQIGVREPCRELQHAREKYFYILIHFAQTNVNYLPLECNIYKTNHAFLMLDAQAFQPREK